MGRNYAVGFPGDESLYQVLQVSPRARPEVIQAAYRVLARLYHPDVSPAPDAEMRTRRLNAAYDVLSDPGRRASYDADCAEASRIAASRSGTVGASRTTRTVASTHVGSSYRGTGTMVLTWIVTSCVALALVVAMLLVLWSLFDTLDTPGGSTRVPRNGTGASLQVPVSSPFGNATGGWTR